MRLSLKNILGDVHQNRTGAAAGGDVERLVNHLRQFGDRLDQKVMFCAGASYAESVGLLESIAADQLGGDLASERDNWNRVHHGVHQPGDEVSCPGSGGGAADSNASG